MKKRTSLAAIIVIVAISGHAQSVNPHHDTAAQEKAAAVNAAKTMRVYKVRTFETAPDGWGYDIYVSGKHVIHQPLIPVVNRNEPFKNEGDAHKVADLVVKKLRSGCMPPTVSINEMDSLKILHQ